MKSYLLRLVGLAVLVCVIASHKTKSRSSASFEKENSKGKYRVESNESAQENSQITDMLSKVLAAKDDKDFQLPDSEESLQQLQSVLTKIPEMIGAKDQDLIAKGSKKEEEEEHKKQQEDQQEQNSTNGEQAQVSQLLSLLKQYNENTQQIKEVQSSALDVTPVPQQKTPSKPLPPYMKQAQEDAKYVESLRMKKVQGEGDKEKPADKKVEGDSDDQEKEQKTVFEKYWEITVPKNYIEESKKNNTKAAAAYTEDSEGRDKIENMSLFEGEVEIKVNRKEVGDEFEVDGLQTQYVRINEHSIYNSANKSSGYRGLLGSIEFEDIITPDDYTLIGKCCQNVFAITEEQFAKGKLFCFKIDTTQVEWTICSKDTGAAEGWRNNLNGFIIVWDLKRKGIFDAKELKKAQKDICAFPIGYNYVNQEQWPCMCAEGLAQSPIELNKEEVKKLVNAQNKWKYTSSSNLITKQFWKETITMGTFGQLEYIDDSGKKHKWAAKEVRFKFPAEHKINGKFHDAELQIVHENAEKERAFVSIMLTAKSVGYEVIDSLIGKFTIDLFADRKQHKAGFIGCLDAKPNLMDILGIKTWQMSFFTYLGSDTIPPCYENVKWFVYEEPVIISPVELNKIRAVVLGDATANNNRHIMPLMNRLVEYWSDPCPQPILPDPVNFQYVKVDGTREVYGIMKKDQELGFDDQVDFEKKKLTVEELNDEEHNKIPADIFETLVKKFQLYLSGKPEEYLYYGDKSKWKQDYKKLVGNIQAKEAKEDFAASQAEKSRRRR